MTATGPFTVDGGASAETTLADPGNGCARRTRNQAPLAPGAAQRPDQHCGSGCRGAYAGLYRMQFGPQAA